MNRNGPTISNTALSDGSFRLESECWLHRPINEVFGFFADAFNLTRLTPPFLHFTILTPPNIKMCEGAFIDYKIRLRGFPIRWRTQITGWDPPYSFEDVQIRGPYRLWQHEHTFVSEKDWTRCRDRVTYRVPGGWLIQKLIVGRDVNRIFSYRNEQLQNIFK